jgi:hypothetical protein
VSKWSIPLGALAVKSKSTIERVGRQATFQLFNAVQLRSPVDTGRFRGNWQVSVGLPAVGTVGADDPSGTIANAEAMKALSIPLGSVAYFTNNLPYARRLEYGWSKQAPAGMVRLSVGEFSRAVRALV